MTIREYGYGIGIFLTYLVPLFVFLLVCYFVFKPKISSKTAETISGNEVLVVLKYEWWRIAWILFFPYTLGLIICYMALSDPTEGLHLIIRIIMIIGISIYTCMLIDILLTKEIVLYRDRVVKTYYALFSTRNILLSTAKYDGVNLPFGFSLKIYHQSQSRIVGAIKGVFLMDITICKKKDVEHFFRMLSELSGRSVDELTSNTWNPILLLREENKHV